MVVSSKWDIWRELSYRNTFLNKIHVLLGIEIAARGLFFPAGGAKDMQWLSLKARNSGFELRLLASQEQRQQAVENVTAKQALHLVAVNVNVQLYRTQR